MKRNVLPLFFALVITTAPLLAQTEKGNGILSGGISLLTTNSRFSQSGTQNAIYPSLSLTAGTFVKDNWLVGGNVMTSLSSTKTDFSASRSTSQNTDLRIRPFVRHYWQAGAVQVFAGGGVSFNSTGTKSEASSSLATPAVVVNKTNTLSVTPYLEAGVNYFLTRRLSLQATASANALPVNVGLFSMGLVYWTGTGSTARQPTGTANPQTDRGRWVLEGSLGLSSTKTTSELASNSPSRKQNQFTISPSAGYFIQKNTIIGIGFPLVFSSSEQVQPGGRTTTTTRNQTIGVSPYYQHYWANNRLTPFTRIDVFYSQSGNSANGSTISTTTSNVGAGGSIGLAYMLGERFIVETSLLSASVNRYVGRGVSEGSKGWTTTVSGQLGQGFSLRYVF